MKAVFGSFVSVWFSNEADGSVHSTYASIEVGVKVR
jgi:hypothetical protein